MKKILLSSVITLITYLSLNAQDLTVCASGCDHTTITAAIAAATSGDVIEVRDAVHTEDNINITKSVTIQGQGRNQTTIQGAATFAAADDEVFRITTSGITVTLREFTLQNGQAISGGSSTNEFGGGIYIFLQGGAGVSLSNLAIKSCSARQVGGAIDVEGPSGNFKMTDCILSGNSANIGGALSITADATAATVTRCSFLSNSAGSQAGALYSAPNNSNITFTSCTFGGNSAGTSSPTFAQGGAIFCAVVTPITFINCTIANNSIAGGSTRQGGGVYFAGAANLSFVNTIIADNTGAASGNDIYIVSSAVSQINCLVEDCATGSGSCPTWSYTSDPNLGSAATCTNGQTFFPPQAPSDAIDNGDNMASGVPTVDICNSTTIVTQDIGSRDIASGLPVTLINFEGAAQPEGNQLSWQTASEINNEGFEIQRSRNGSSWEKLTFIQGMGTSFTGKTYAYIDDSPEPNINYYRLKQMDFDGSYEFSNVISIISGNASRKAALLLSPNPVQNELMIQNGIGTVTIYNLLGQPLKTIQSIATQQAIDVSMLAKGQYVLQVKKADGSMSTARFVK